MLLAMWTYLPNYTELLMQLSVSEGQHHKYLFSYCSYMVDAADLEKVEASKNELHSLIDKPQLHGIPVRILIFIVLTGP